MNVAVTRARRQCCIVCNVETVGKDKFLKRLVDHFEANGEYLSAMEYLWNQAACLGQFYQQILVEEWNNSVEGAFDAKA